MTITQAQFEMEELLDSDPDLSYLGEYSNDPEKHHIDREERGDMECNQYHFFNLGCGDPDYIEQDYKRMEAYNRGEWYMIGIRANIELEIETSSGTITQTISSPGLWGIESDSSDEYKAEIFQQECTILKEMVEALGVKVQSTVKE